MAYTNSRNNIARRRPRRLIAVGDLNKKITLQTRELRAGMLQNVSDVAFTDVIEVWAMVETSRGLIQLDQAEQKTSTVTHKFYIRFRELTQEKFVLYKNNRYDILDVEDLDERSEFLCLRCCKLGDQEAESTWG